MNKEDVFLEKIADILECDADNIDMNTDFRNDIEDWDSLKGFSMLIMFEEDYDKKVSVDRFLECRKIKDLYDEMTK